MPRHYRTGEPLGDDDGFLSPALFDLQVNGALGIGFNSPTLEAGQVRRVVDHLRSHGVAGFLPTVITDSAERIAKSFRTLTAARLSDPSVAAAVPGYHLEGPYIAGDDGPRGAHPKVHVRDPELDEVLRWQEAADGLIRLVTLAPERPGALRFIEELVGRGVVVALGHTAASGATIRDAVAAGARLSTHLGNGAAAMIHRHDNPIWEQLAADGLWASMIPDGHHLPAALVKTIVRTKLGRTIITCDASSLAGLPPARYREWGTDVEVLADGRVVLAGTPYLAGSGVFTDTCVAVAARQAGIPLADAIDLASSAPRSLLGLPPWNLGPATPQMTFDVVDGDLRVREVTCP